MRKTLPLLPLFIAPLVLSACSVFKLPEDKSKEVEFSDAYVSALNDHYLRDKKFKEALDRYAVADGYQKIDSDINEEKSRDKLRLAVIVKEQTERSSAIRRYESELRMLTHQTTMVERRRQALAQQREELLKDRKKNEKRLAQNDEETEKQLTDHARLVDEAAFTGEVLKLEKENYLLAHNESVHLKGKTYPEPHDLAKRKIRNDLINDFLAMSDAHYLDFKRQLLSGRASTEAMVDLSNLAMSTATTLVGGATSKANLGAAMTLLSGSRATVDKTFFAANTTRAIINTIEDGRARDRILIVTGMKQSSNDYPLSQALSDIRRYQSRADLFNAVLDVANQTATNAQQSESRLRDKEKTQ